MHNIMPQKLRAGDEVRIVAPSTGLKIIGADCRKIAEERFAEMGLKVSFGRNTNDENFDMFGSATVQKRAEDIMDAFKDKNIKAIFTVIGGFNSNQILPFLDYEVIRENPKIICGFSDITALLNGIRAKTGLVAFYGPHYSSLGMKKGCEYTLDVLKKMLFDEEYNWQPAAEWSDDLWFINQEERCFEKNGGWWFLQTGNAEGRLEGGNVSSLILLNGTPYQPVFAEDTVLMIEECFVSQSSDAKEFLRCFQALAQREDFANVRAVLIGRFQKASDVTREKLEYIVRNIPQLAGLPVIANMDFGHTTPIATLPLGGYCKIRDGKITVSLAEKADA